jgi:hypothetical protein
VNGAVSELLRKETGTPELRDASVYRRAPAGELQPATMDGHRCQATTGGVGNGTSSGHINAAINACERRYRLWGVVSVESTAGAECGVFVGVLADSGVSNPFCSNFRR